MIYEFIDPKIHNDPHKITHLIASNEHNDIN